MTIDEARVWLQRHADNTPMPGAREVYKTILEALRRTRWVPVVEDTPPERTFVVCSDGHVVFMSMLVGNDWLTGGWIRGIKPTHWMPLPEPPGVE